jgi:hypothetical protein
LGQFVTSRHHGVTAVVTTLKLLIAKGLSIVSPLSPHFSDWIGVSCGRVCARARVTYISLLKSVVIVVIEYFYRCPHDFPRHHRDGDSVVTRGDTPRCLGSSSDLPRDMFPPPLRAAPIHSLPIWPQRFSAARYSVLRPASTCDAIAPAQLLQGRLLRLSRSTWRDLVCASYPPTWRDPPPPPATTPLPGATWCAPAIHPIPREANHG